MNKVCLIGRLTRDPDVRYTDNNLAVARYTLAVNRRFKRDGEQQADFINIVAFGKAGEFAEKYFKKGMQVAVSGRIQTGSYMKDDRKVYTFDIVAEEQDFTESRKAYEERMGGEPTQSATTDEGFVPVEDDDSDLPF